MLQRTTDHHVAFRRVEAVPFDSPSPRDVEREAFAAILRSFKRNLGRIVLITLLGTGGITLFVLSITPQYQVSTTILVDPRKTQILKDREVVGAPGTDSSAIDSEAEMLQSPALVRRVVERLKLDQDEELSSSGVVGRIKGLVTALLRNVGLEDQQGRDGDAIANAAAVLQRKISAQRRGLTYVIQVTVWSQDAEKAARIANTVTEIYISDQIAAKSDAAGKANALLNRRLDELRHGVTASENAYEKYKAQAGLFDPGGESLSDRQISQLNEQLVTARARAAEAWAKFEQLRKITPAKLSSAAASPDVLQSAVVSNLRTQYAEVARKKAELTTRYGPRHPQVVNIEAELENVSRQITDEIGRIVASARTEFEMAKSREESLQASLDELKERATKLDQKSIKLHELEREAKANRQLYEEFLSRAKETSAQLDMQLPDSRVIAAALAPNAPSYPRKGLMIGLGFFGSLGLGMATALMLARGEAGQGFRRMGELQAAFRLLPLATIPLVEGFGPHAAQRRRLLSGPGSRDKGGLQFDRYAPESSVATSRQLSNLVLNDPNSDFAESVHSLRIALKARANARRMKIVLVTSALQGEGKSTIAANLARASSVVGERVLLIDADLRTQGLAAAFGLARSPGLAELLSGEVDVAGCMHFEAQSRLRFIAGTKVLNGAQALSLLSSAGMQRLLDASRGQFDLVIVDAPPLLPVADARVLIEQVDGVVLVVASEDTSQEALSTVYRETFGFAEKIIGVVLNRAAPDVDRYYYGDEKPASKVRRVSR
jgi:exopolysaccharide transport family protein